MAGFFQDLRYAMRQLRQNLGFAITSILILSLGICASVAIFGFVDAALIKPLPYANPNQLVLVTESVPMIPRANLSYLDYLDWKKLNTVFSSMDVYHDTGYLLRTPTGTEPVAAMQVSDGFLRTLGIAPLLGRDFYTGEDLPAAPQTVILSYAAWQKRFGGRKEVIGQAVHAQRDSIHDRRSAASEFSVCSRRRKRRILDDTARFRQLRSPAKLPRPDRDRAAEGGSLRRRGSG